MRLFVTGASGLVGSALCRDRVARGDQIVALSRVRRPDGDAIRWVVGDENDPAAWRGAVDGCDAVVNLAGAPVATRWTRANRLAIVRSRVGVTTALYHALTAAEQRPAVMISASAIGYYGTDLEATFTEESPRGRGFLADVCAEWEAAAQRSEALGVRVVRLRIGVVLDAAGGALPALARPMRLFAGGALGSGAQWLSWIQLADLVALIGAALADARYSGALNATGPAPARQRDFAAALARELHRPSWLDVPSWTMKLLVGAMAEEVLLGGQRVLPACALANGFTFAYPELAAALRASFSGLTPAGGQR